MYTVQFIGGSHPYSAGTPPTYSGDRGFLLTTIQATFLKGGLHRGRVSDFDTCMFWALAHSPRRGLGPCFPRNLGNLDSLIAILRQSDVY